MMSKALTAGTDMYVFLKVAIQISKIVEFQVQSPESINRCTMGDCFETWSECDKAHGYYARQTLASAVLLHSLLFSRLHHEKKKSSLIARLNPNRLQEYLEIAKYKNSTWFKFCFLFVLVRNTLLV